MTQPRTYRTGKTASAKRLAIAVLVFGGLTWACWEGWQWRTELRIDRIVVEGAHHAQRDSLLRVARVSEGDRLYALDPATIADRLRRHPWVAGAEVTRLPTGTLRLEVRERTPVVRVSDALSSAAGRTSYYLDARGYAMPLTADTIYPVPRLDGLKAPYQPLRPLTDEATRALLNAVAAAPKSQRQLVARLERTTSGRFRLHTRPTRHHPSVTVRLGTSGFPEKLGRLYAFWRQAVMTQPKMHFESIDLRFDGQIITNEASPSAG